MFFQTIDPEVDQMTKARSFCNNGDELSLVDVLLQDLQTS